MVEFKRTSSENADFLNLIRELDSFLDKVDKNAMQFVSNTMLQNR